MHAHPMKVLLVVVFAAFAVLGSVSCTRDSSQPHEPAGDRDEQLKPLKQVAELVERYVVEYQAGRLRAANDTLDQVLKIQQRLYPASKHPDGHLEIAETLEELGQVQFELDEFAKAREWLDRSRSMVRALDPDGKDRRAQAQLSSVLYWLGWVAENGDEIEEFCREAVSIDRKLYPKSEFPRGSLQLAKSIGRLAVVLSQQGKIREAPRVFLEALEMRRALVPDGDQETVLLLTRLTQVFMERTEFDKAKQYIDEAVDLCPRVPRDTFPAGRVEARVLIRKGSLANLLGDYEIAQETLEKALAILTANGVPRGDSDRLAVLSTLAMIHISQHQHFIAEQYSLEVLAGYQTLFPEDPDGHVTIASALDRLADVYHAQGDDATAENYSKRVLEMCERIFPPERYADGHIKLFRANHHRAMILYTLGNIAESEKYFEQALAIARKLYPEEHPDLAYILDDLGLALSRRGEFARGRSLLEESQRMFKAVYPADEYPQGNEKWAHLLDDLGRHYSWQGNPGRALENFTAALDMQQRLYPKAAFPAGHPGIMGELQMLGLVSQQMGDYKGAADYLVRAAEMKWKVTESFARLRSEAEALNFYALVDDPQLRLLSVLPETDR